MQGINEIVRRLEAAGPAIGIFAASSYRVAGAQLVAVTCRDEHGLPAARVFGIPDSHAIESMLRDSAAEGRAIARDDELALLDWDGANTITDSDTHLESAVGQALIHALERYELKADM